MFSLMIQEKNGYPEISKYEFSSCVLLNQKNQQHQGKIYANLKSFYLENIQDTFSIYYARQINFLKNNQSTNDGIIVKNVKGCHFQDDNTADQHNF